MTKSKKVQKNNSKKVLNIKSAENVVVNSNVGTSNVASEKPVILAAALMVKNEKLRIGVSLKSIKGFVDKLIILDTGSTDETIDIIRQFCESNKIPLDLVQEDFVDYSTSRNVLLKFADDKADYLLLMDCNDELRKGEELRKHVDTYKGKGVIFFLTMSWFCGSSFTHYYSTRLIKTKSDLWYKGVVHEYIDSKTNVPEKFETIGLYQDRTKDDDKSSKRFPRDKVLLSKAFDDDPKNTRTVFYLAQTCSCLQHWSETYKYAKLRTTMGGFHEEIFQAYMMIGNAACNMGLPWEESMIWYLKAYSFMARVEPLCKLISHYRAIDSWHMAYLFAKQAIDLNYPKDAVLFVDKRCYDYLRWFEMAIICDHYKEVNQKKVGLFSIIKALQNGDEDLDKRNANSYVSQEHHDTFIKLTKSNRDTDPIVIIRHMARLDPTVFEYAGDCLPPTKPITHKEKLQMKLQQKKKQLQNN